MSEREKKMFTLLHDVAYILVLQSEGRLNQKQFEEWREKWIQEFGRLMLEMVEEQQKQIEGPKNGEA